MGCYIYIYVYIYIYILIYGSIFYYITLHDCEGQSNLTELCVVQCLESLLTTAAELGSLATLEKARLRPCRFCPALQPL